MNPRLIHLIPFCVLALVTAAAAEPAKSRPIAEAVARPASEAVARPASEAVVDFNREIRPILNTQCVKCHGGVKQAGQLNLQFRADALKGGKSGKPAIVPGDAAHSEMLLRIKASNPDARMPKQADALTAAQTDAISRWIAQGAEWANHWSYVAPQRHAPPATRFPARTAVDKFLFARLEKEGLAPSPEADRSTLLRRVSLDLIGLPPTPAEVDAFVTNAAPDAYEQEVDRLLASPRFGERWAAWWMDLARYADSMGYEKDGPRTMWPYRDWLIDAFNRDEPFDQFSIEQLAGDLLPGATEEQVIATAFHRSTMNNTEGGTDDEEFRVAAVLDRASTTMEIWNGQTWGCIQCHGHPYDPFVQREFYEVLAFFNQSADSDKDDDRPTRKVKGSGGEANLPVMQELAANQQRVTFIFERGNFLNTGATVTARTPASLHAFPAGEPTNRLGFARWMVSTNSPLVARVTVNRFWEQLFGIGLVETLEDFGSQGEPPAHPELLDDLAVRFQTDLKWSMKKLLRELAVSAAYRQSSVVTASLRERDPRNRLLARGPRFRLTAEQLRDQALTASGLLSAKQHGSPVMPSQPPGVWLTPYNNSDWATSPGEDAYRRALYTHWRRSSPYPSALNFDAAPRDICVSRRLRTNTPLQALNLLNDRAYLDCAAALARRMAEAGGTNAVAAVGEGVRRVLGRAPRDVELKQLLALHDRARADFAKDEAAAKQFGDSVDHAAWTLVANALLNLDEVVTKQ